MGRLGHDPPGMQTVPNATEFFSRFFICINQTENKLVLACCRASRRGQGYKKGKDTLLCVIKPDRHLDHKVTADFRKLEGKFSIQKIGGQLESHFFTPPRQSP